MRAHRSIVNRIMFMIILTGLVIGAVIITAGSRMIYRATENGIHTEVSMAARSFGNTYLAKYDGVLTYDGAVCRAGDVVIDENEFSLLTSDIGCSEDVDFTLFYGDTRVLTSVRNTDGSLAVGTKAAAEVCEAVLESGRVYDSHRVLVNDRYYLGCYLPIRAGENVVGMIFAGRPLDSAEANAAAAAWRFIGLAIGTLVVALAACMVGTRRIVTDLVNIRDYLGRLADGDFNVDIPAKTLKRKDEIGQISASAVKVRQNLRDMVERDPLTSLYNRRGCRSLIDRLSENGIGYTVVMGDIDFFKKINDTYGHAAGDYILKEISALLRGCTKDNNGFASRWGGEEFLLILPRTELKKAQDIISALLDRIRASEFVSDGTQIPVTMTFGIAENGGKEDFEAAVSRADELLYKGKTSGRNRIVSEDTVAV